MTKKILIIGAGPAGLFCAHELVKYGMAPIIIEKEDHVGGLAATHHCKFGSFEIGPHIFHTKDQYIMDIARSYLGNDLLLKDWKVTQFIEGKLFVFPNSIKDMISKLGIVRMLGFILSYILSQLTTGKDFRSFIYKKVGKRLAHFNVINYTEKMWGIPIEDLEVGWIKPRMNRLSIWKIIKTFVKGHERSFHYPNLGSGMLYELIAKNVEVQLQEWPISIEVDQNKVIIKTNKDSYEVDHLISSIPLITLYELLHIKHHNPSKLQIESLKHRSQVYVMLTYDRADIIEDLWIYFPEPHYPFCRVHSAGAFSDAHVRGQVSILVFEYFCFEGDVLWNTSDQELITLTSLHFNKTSLIENAQIIDSLVLRQSKAYPLMDKRRLKSINDIQSSINHQCIHLIGRHGLHTYDNQDEAGRTGVDTALKILKKNSIRPSHGSLY